jgi:hypothetical protein
VTVSISHHARGRRGRHRRAGDGIGVFAAAFAVLGAVPVVPVLLTIVSLYGR